MKIIPVSYQDAAKKKNIFIPLFKEDNLAKQELFSCLPDSVKTAVAKLAKEEFKADEGETRSVWFPSGTTRRVRLFGLGEKAKWNPRRTQVLARNFVRYAKGERIDEFAAVLSPTSNPPVGGLKDDAARFAMNALMADFEFNKYRQKPKDGWPEVKTVYLAGDTKDLAETKTGIEAGMIIGEEVNSCRHLANTPGSDMTPSLLAQAARDASKNKKIRVRVMEEPEMKRLHMGGILGVASGSDEKPKLIILEYFGLPKATNLERSRKKSRNGPSSPSGRLERPLVLVGKGVTFDSGGLNVKPHPHMYEMHMDMSGGAAVIHGIAAIARLKLPINVIGIIPAVENMPSGSSYRPGDLLKTHSGKVIEVLNTDAEGRVILADALSYGAKRYKPGLLIDFATLTGAAHGALGNHCSAIFTQDEKLQQHLVEIGNVSGDHVWPLPLWDEYLPEIKATFGDLANISTTSDRAGGAIHGAKFLEQFAEGSRFAHVDIAPRMTTIDSDCMSKGASGVGVRFIVELAKQYPKL
ncbi:MAG: leucyl aminopeptidase family protein [Candidatus Sungbacteria bacterium]|nr:leucyl aminopeptidase family protein [Candidatus Sungbacteria bacterium]